MPGETPTHVVLKYKDPSVAHYAAVVPEGTDPDDVVAAWRPLGWQRGAKTELDDLLDKPTNPPAEPVTTTERKN